MQVYAGRLVPQSLQFVICTAERLNTNHTKVVKDKIRVKLLVQGAQVTSQPTERCRSRGVALPFPIVGLEYDCDTPPVGRNSYRGPELGPVKAATIWNDDKHISHIEHGIVDSHLSN
jgi:hypothetical protein